MNNIDLYRYSHKGNGEASNDTRFKDLVERKITVVDDSEITVVGTYTFGYCRALVSVNFPNVTNIGSNAFNFCTSLKKVDLPIVEYLSGYSFRDCTALTTLIIRSKTVCTLVNVNAFTSTPIESGSGYVYVPAELFDSYKTATNWTTFADQIRAIEDYPEITGG